jgi:hypothetical protein
MITLPQTQDPRRAPSAAVSPPLARPAILCLAPLVATAPGPLGILRHQLPSFRSTGLDHHATEAILR